MTARWSIPACQLSSANLAKADKPADTFLLVTLDLIRGPAALLSGPVSVLPQCKRDGCWKAQHFARPHFPTPPPPDMIMAALSNR